MDNPNPSSDRTTRMKDLFKQYKELDEAESSFLHTPPLHEAIANQNHTEVLRLLDAGADINERDWYEATPLLQVVQLAGLPEEDQATRTLLSGKVPSFLTGLTKTAENPDATLDLMRSLLPTPKQWSQKQKEGLDRRRKEADKAPESRSKPARQEDIALLRLLIERGADLEAGDK